MRGMIGGWGRWVVFGAIAGLVACGDDSRGTVDASEVAPDEVLDDVSETEPQPEVEVTPEVVVPDPATTILLLDEGTTMAFGLSKIFEVEVPANVVSVTISVMGDESTYYALGDWVGPNGFELVRPLWAQTDEGGGGLCLSCNNRISLSAGAFASIAPNNPAAEVEPGLHKFSLIGFTAPAVVQGQGECGDAICQSAEQLDCARDCGAKAARGPVKVLVHAKVAEGGPPATGVLDLNLHFTGAQGLTAEKAPTDPKFQATLEAMRTIYRQVGIELGVITYRDIDPAYRTIETLDGAGSDLQAMFSESAGNTSALNLFFVNEIATGQLGASSILLGISGGIPGPYTQGSWRSGVAIAIKPIWGVPSDIETTMAHETGHFLGLYHTTEYTPYSPDQHDPLPDTPDNDPTYLMFNSGSGTTLSEWQGRVMRSSPWVRHPAN